MSLSMHQASIPVFLRGLRVMSTLLDKAASHATEHKTDPDTLVQTRLAPDMLNLAGQIQRATDSAKLGIARLGGLTAPPFADDETTLDALQQRLAKTIAYLESVDPAVLDGSDMREILLKAGGQEQVFDGASYLLTFALPNFFFHMTTTYAVLRHAGVAVGKRDYLGPYGKTA
jgi:hypothetical protein